MQIKAGDTVKALVDLNIDGDKWIKAGDVGIVIKVDPCPANIEEKHWYAYEVIFEGDCDDEYLCKSHEIAKE